MGWEAIFKVNVASRKDVVLNIIMSGERFLIVCRNTVVIVNATANHNQGKYDKEPMSVAEK